MAEGSNRYRHDDYDDEPPLSSSRDNEATTIIGTIFGIWATIIGLFGAIWLGIAAIFFLIFATVFCFIFMMIALMISSIPQPGPIPGGPPNISPIDQAKLKPRAIDPTWNDAALTRTWLSDLNEIDPKVGFGKFGKKGQLGYGIKPGEQDSPITFNRQRQPQALSTAPSAFVTATVKYKLDKQYKLFKASVACNDLDPGESGPRSPLTFKVLGDGDLLWVSEPVNLIGRKQDVRISVAGVDMLELQVHCGDGYNARAIWIDPQVLK